VAKARGEFDDKELVCVANLLCCGDRPEWKIFHDEICLILGNADKVRCERIEEIFKKYGINNLYHFTHLKNLESIKRHGLWARGLQQEKGIMCEFCGGDDMSYSLDKNKMLDKHVHLSISHGWDNPMFYKVKERMKESRQNFKFLQIDVSVAIEAGVLFANDNVTKNGVVPCSRVDYLEKMLEERREILARGKNNGDADTKRANQMEVMVPKFIPIKFIREDEYNPYGFCRNPNIIPPIELPF